ncbi:unnamed protein product [marine sediment metagenome]|uniref:Uncharacterized protein n=1 Tax=marine sediment metagenome TaxID=412755 RepID=X1PHU4_9ZZZZ
MAYRVYLPLSDFIIIILLSFILRVPLTLFTAATRKLRRISKKLKEVRK